MNKIIETRVEEILTEFNIDSVPVSFDEIVKKYQIIVKKASSNEFSGLLFKKEGDDVSYIAINSKENIVRQRFTLAHELGHYFLHPQKNTFIEYRDNQKNTVRGKKEKEANQFAAALLMPKKILVKDVKSFGEGGILLEHIKFLAQKYKVSADAMSYRLINLNLS